MLQGTGSSVGKSLLVAGYGRVFARRGLRVQPFKPQNMSNNAAVTRDGGEIGRAQALQAMACGVAPSVHHNPVLLKPQTDVGAQVVVQGHAVGSSGAREYQSRKPELLAAVLDSFAHVCADADLVLVEGAGSPAEVNLRDGDIANMGFAIPSRTPVILVGDIERGGVIASLVGTLEVLSEEDRACIRGFIVNKLRGDPTLFIDGERFTEQRMGVPSLGVVPFFPRASLLPAEDAVDLGSDQADPTAIKVAVPMFSRISNFDDLDPLRVESDVRVIMVAPGEPLPADADLVILPGTKATRGDLDFLRAQGWDIDIKAHGRRGGAVLGICGGYQMLGTVVSDPEGIEGEAGETPGLGLLDVQTVLAPRKRLREVQGEHLGSGLAVRGYEIHQGQTRGPDCCRPLLRLGGEPDGACSARGPIYGCYLHGLFRADSFRAAFLESLRAGRAGGQCYDAITEEILDAWADHLVQYTDVDRLLAFAGRIGAP